MKGDKHPEPKGWGDNGEVSCTGFQVFSILGSNNKAVVQIGLALKSCPPDDSDGDGRKGRREKGRLIWPWESHERADRKRNIWGSGRSTGQGVGDLESSVRRPLPSSMS